MVWWLSQEIKNVPFSASRYRQVIHLMALRKMEQHPSKGAYHGEDQPYCDRQPGSGQERPA
jgi:hypothetical protein